MFAWKMKPTSVRSGVCLLWTLASFLWLTRVETIGQSSPPFYGVRPGERDGKGGPLVRIMYAKGIRLLRTTCHGLNSYIDEPPTASVWEELYQKLFKIVKIMNLPLLNFSHPNELYAQRLCDEYGDVYNVPGVSGIPADDFFCGSTESGIDWTLLSGRSDTPLISQCTDTISWDVPIAAKLFDVVDTTGVTASNYCEHLSKKQKALNVCFTYGDGTNGNTPNFFSSIGIFHYNFAPFECMIGLYASNSVLYCKHCRCPTSEARKKLDGRNHDLKYWNTLFTNTNNLLDGLSVAEISPPVIPQNR